MGRKNKREDKGKGEFGQRQNLRKTKREIKVMIEWREEAIIEEIEKKWTYVKRKKNKENNE